MIKKIFLIVILLIILSIAGCLGYYYYFLFRKGSGDAQEFIVKQGQTTREIAENLKTQKIISSPIVFEIYAKTKHALLQIGVYKLSSAQNISEIVDILNTGKTSEDIILIPEGWRVTQIDEYLAKKGIINQGELTQIASADEGYLFPDTYRFLPKSNPQEIKKTMIDNFKKKTAGMNVTRETVILASIVEREAKFDEDRPKIAGVYLNRLDKGMKLEADPTIQYAKGNWDPIKVSDYRGFESLYNTYLNEGLPPGSICNPGLKSIEAVLYPQKYGWFYFFHKQDGHAVYSVTIDEHEENLKKFQ
ncbi:MAG: Endolytic murein transglycosylase [Candidatus Berkelbacteria bacterium]|nr:Endolytic murein transglycosylase [Candidatus Berkelbacteria bacterium]